MAKAKSPNRRRSQSLFFKLYAILLCAGLLTHLSVIGFFHFIWNPSGRESADRNLTHYAELLANEIGMLPDTVLAAKMAENLGLAIAIHRPQGWWFSRQVPAHFQERLRLRPPGDSLQLRFRHGRLLAVIPRAPNLFVFGSVLRQPVESRVQHWLWLIGLISLAWLIAWLLIRNLLRPVRRLAEGVAAVEAGNLDIRLPEAGHDELAELARSFNSMTLSLRERLLARDQLLLDVSHELRSPLTRMRVELEMAPSGPAVESLQEEVALLEKMVSEILETERFQSKAGQLRRETVDLTALVSEVVAEFGPRTPGIVWKSAVEAMPAPLDPERVRVLLRNLIENSLKYGVGAQRSIEVTLSAEDGEPGNYARLEVRDFGQGIPEEEQRLVFEPFYRVDRSRTRTQGYGLGLSLCKRIVEAHGGTIDLKSRLGEGTTVTVRLPLD